MMLGMYAAWYMFAGFGILAFMGSYVGPIAAAVLTGPILFVVGYYMHQTLIARVTGHRVASAEAEGHYAQLILTLGISLILQNGGLILFSSEPRSIRTPLSSSAWELMRSGPTPCRCSSTRPEWSVRLCRSALRWCCSYS